MRTSGRLQADLSGWRDTHSEAADLMPGVPVDLSRLDRYYLDEGDALGDVKRQILLLLAAWENRPLSGEEVTLAPSVSAANFQVLIALKRRGFNTILFETPAYAVTINQAIHAGFEVISLPTYLREDFHCSFPDELLSKHAPCIIWLTQPRMSLGFDQNLTNLADLASRAKGRAVIVIDEATEQRFPSHLRSLMNSNNRHVIRTRGITKGLGLNGLRVACTIHDPELRDAMESTQDVTGISLDYFSLTATGLLGTDVGRFKKMLVAANEQTTRLCQRLQKLVVGSPLTPSDLTNGYIGSLSLRIPPSTANETLRRRLLRYCSENGTFVILGASMRFAYDRDYEFIRVNYFNREHHVIGGVESLLRFSALLVRD